MEIKKLRRTIVDEIARRNIISRRGRSRQRAVNRKMKNWNIKKDFSMRQAPTKPVIRIQCAVLRLKGEY